MLGCFGGQAIDKGSEANGAQGRGADTRDHSNTSDNVRANCASLDGKGNISGLPNRFPIVIAEWDRNKREVIRVALDQYNGRHTVNVRVWYRDGNGLKPGKTGITLALSHLSALADALALADRRACELGLIGGGDQ